MEKVDILELTELLHKKLKDMTAERDRLREALMDARDLIFEHHYIGHVERTYRQGFGDCEACCKNDALEKLYAVLDKDAKG